MKCKGSETQKTGALVGMVGWLSEEKRSISILRVGNPCGQSWPPKYSEQPTCRFNQAVNKQTQCAEETAEWRFLWHNMFCTVWWFAVNPPFLESLSNMFIWWRERQKASFIVSQFVQMQNMESPIYFHNVDSLDDDNRCLFNAFKDKDVDNTTSQPGKQLVAQWLLTNRKDRAALGRGSISSCGIFWNTAQFSLRFTCLHFYI